jgi:hypothetical protein
MRRFPQHSNRVIGAIANPSSDTNGKERIECCIKAKNQSTVASTSAVEGKLADYKVACLKLEEEEEND